VCKQDVKHQGKKLAAIGSGKGAGSCVQRRDSITWEHDDSVLKVSPVQSGEEAPGSLAGAGTCLLRRVGARLPGQGTGKDPGPKKLNQRGFLLEAMKD